MDPLCECYTCRNFSKAYLRHLFAVGEILSSVSNSIHNISFYLRLMKELRSVISSPAASGPESEHNEFDTFTQKF